MWIGAAPVHLTVQPWPPRPMGPKGDGCQGGERSQPMARPPIRKGHAELNHRSRLALMVYQLDG